MNRRIRNRTYGGVGGREPRGSLLPVIDALLPRELPNAGVRKVSPVYPLTRTPYTDHQ